MLINKNDATDLYQWLKININLIRFNVTGKLGCRLYLRQRATEHTIRIVHDKTSRVNLFNQNPYQYFRYKGYH